MSSKPTTLCPLVDKSFVFSRFFRVGRSERRRRIWHLHVAVPEVPPYRAPILPLFPSRTAFSISCNP